MRYNVFDQNKPKDTHDYENNIFADFLLNKGLYDKIEISQENFLQLFDLIAGNVKISVYCTKCKEMRVFTMLPIEFVFENDDDEKEVRSLAKVLNNLQNKQAMEEMIPPITPKNNRDWYWSNQITEKATRIMTFSFTCAMNNNHHLDYIVQTDGNIMKKIGQYPSVADLSFHELDEFKKDIDEETRKEYGRAIGLYAQGIGVGSYVYLRRIFERILETAKGHAESDDNVDLSTYNLLHIPERIRLLKEYLPDIITDNPAFYGIVSKGIHELSEDDCIKYFPVLQETIFLILRQWAQKRKEQEYKKKVEAALSDLTRRLS